MKTRRFVATACALLMATSVSMAGAATPSETSTLAKEGAKTVSTAQIPTTKELLASGQLNLLQVPTLYLDVPIDSMNGQGYGPIYSFTPSVTGTYIFTTSPYKGTGGSSDTYLELYKDEAMDQLIAENDDYNGTVFSQISTTLKKGNTYYLVVRGYAWNAFNCRLLVTAL